MKKLIPDREKCTVVVHWQDAAYTHEVEFPAVGPLLDHVTFGVILEETDDHILVGMNCWYDPATNEVAGCCADTLLIPRKAVKTISRIGPWNVHPKKS